MHKHDNSIYLNKIYNFLILAEQNKNASEKLSFLCGQQVLFFFSEDALNSAFVKKRDHMREHRRSIECSLKILNQLISNTLQLEVISKETLPPLVSMRYREQAYFPVEFPIGTEKFMLYIYAWISDRKNINTFLQTPFRIKEFVLAGCLFGTYILGRSLKDKKIYPLIDHHIKNTDLIDCVFSKKKLHPYEVLLFSNFSILAQLFDFFPGKPVVRYHLPAIDYVLFGVRLYLEHKMSLHALITYVKHVKHRASRHKAIILKIANYYHLNILIESPFKNLFGELHDKKSKHIVEFFIKDLDMLPADLRQSILTNRLLAQLSEHDHDLMHQSVWRSIRGNNKKINCIEELLKTGNTALIACATQGKQDYETCSFLQIDEKSIAKNYADNLEKFFTKVIYMTFLFNVVDNLPQDKNNIFNFGPGSEKCSSEKKINFLIFDQFKLSPSVQNFIQERRKNFHFLKKYF